MIAYVAIAVEITTSTVWLGQVCTEYLFVYLQLLLPLVGWLESLFYSEARRCSAMALRVWGR